MRSIVDMSESSSRMYSVVRLLAGSMCVMVLCSSCVASEYQKEADRLLGELALADCSDASDDIEAHLADLRAIGSEAYFAGVQVVGSRMMFSGNSEAATHFLLDRLDQVQMPGRLVLNIAEAAHGDAGLCSEALKRIHDTRFAQREDEFAGRLGRYRLQTACGGSRREEDLAWISQYRAETTYRTRWREILPVVEDLLAAYVARINNNPWEHLVARAVETVCHTDRLSELLLRGENLEARVPSWYGARIDAIGIIVELSRDETIVAGLTGETRSCIGKLVSRIRVESAQYVNSFGEIEPVLQAVESQVCSPQPDECTGPANVNGYDEHERNDE